MKNQNLKRGTGDRTRMWPANGSHKPIYLYRLQLLLTAIIKITSTIYNGYINHYRKDITQW